MQTIVVAAIIVVVLACAYYAFAPHDKFKDGPVQKNPNHRGADRALLAEQSVHRFNACGIALQKSLALLDNLGPSANITQRQAANMAVYNALTDCIKAKAQLHAVGHAPRVGPRIAAPYANTQLHLQMAELARIASARTNALREASAQHQRAVCAGVARAAPARADAKRARKTGFVSGPALSYTPVVAYTVYAANNQHFALPVNTPPPVPATPLGNIYGEDIADSIVSDVEGPEGAIAVAVLSNPGAALAYIENPTAWVKTAREIINNPAQMFVGAAGYVGGIYGQIAAQAIIHGGNSVVQLITNPAQTAGQFSAGVVGGLNAALGDINSAFNPFGYNPGLSLGNAQQDGTAVSNALSTAYNATASGVTSAANTVAADATSAYNTVAAGATSVANTVASDATSWWGDVKSWF